MGLLLSLVDSLGLTLSFQVDGQTSSTGGGWVEIPVVKLHDLRHGYQLDLFSIALGCLLLVVLKI